MHIQIIVTVISLVCSTDLVKVI